MKKFLILVLIIPIFLMAGCLDNYVPVEEHNKLQEEYNQLKENSYTTEVKLYSELSQQEEKLKLSQEEVKGYENLIDNLNEFLSCVYYGYASNENWESDGFTAFSIFHNDEIYIITAGHCVENEYGRFYNFKFKANFTNTWIYPKLLTYENDYYGNRDYAIFYSDKVTNGLNYDLKNSYPKFILGNIDKNILKEFNIYNLLEGESGSPVVDLDGEIIGIATGNFVDVDLVIEAIDELE